MSLLMENSVAKIGCGDPGDLIEFAAFFETNTTRMVRSFGAGDTTKWAISEWLRLPVNGSVVQLLYTFLDDPNNSIIYWRGDLGGKLQYQNQVSNSIITDLISTGSYLDGALYFHSYTEYDSGQAVPADRFKRWINRTLIETNADFPDLLETAYFNSAIEHRMQGQHWRAETAFFDGIHPGLDAFTRVNADGFPVAKAFEDIGGGAAVYGANGYHLDFADPLNMGNDVSGNGNHWTVTVGTVTQVTDAPGLLNVALLDPNAAKGSGTLSNGNLTYSVANNNVNDLMASTLQTDGVQNFSALANVTLPFTGVGFALNDGRVCFYYAQSGTISVPWEADQTGLPTGTAQFEILVDHDLGQVRFKRNGSFVGVPVSIPSNEPVRFATRGQSAADPASVDWDFGQAGYVPSESGYHLLSIGNLSCPEVLNPRAYVDRRECLGGAGVSDLEFSPLVHDVVIFSGRRDTAVDWRLNYSIGGVLQDPICTNDPAAGPIVGEAGMTLTSNGFDVGAATPYQGTCWHRIFRVGGLGRLSVTRVNHTGGSTVASHTSGRPIAFGFIIPRAGGDIRTFHHKADAGDYWLLNSNAGFGNDPGWFASSANDLTLGGSLPAGIYDVIGWPEVDQFSSFSKVKCNGLVDGPQDPCDYTPLLMLGRKQGAGESNWIMDRKVNPVTTMQYLNGTTTLYSSSGYAIDFNSNGLKWRTNSSSWNPAGGYVFTASWAYAPIKFSTAQ